MSDFSYTARCRKHGITFAPDDGGCPWCDAERCETCGALPDNDGEYPCECKETENEDEEYFTRR